MKKVIPWLQLIGGIIGLLAAILALIVALNSMSTARKAEEKVDSIYNEMKAVKKGVDLHGQKLEKISK